MKKQLSRTTLAAAAMAAVLGGSPGAWAQVAGSTTTVEATVTESVRLTSGWSVKKTLMGKTIYNEAGVKVGKIDDLIISTDRHVSYVLVKAGGFVGIGRHDVAIPVAQIENRSGKLVMDGATPASVKAMPEFKYATDTTRRDQLVAAVDRDIAHGRAKLAELEKMAETASTDAKARIDVQMGALQRDVKTSEDQLAEMKHATVERWSEFEVGLNAATARLRQSIHDAAG